MSDIPELASQEIIHFDARPFSTHIFYRTAEGFNDFPVDLSYFPAIKKRVNLAKKIDKHMHTKRKEKSDTDWFRKQAEAMDIELDEVLNRRNPNIPLLN